ncbi:MAG: outer membrane beta-barrel protein [Pseudomonadota bacterium]
MRNRMAVLSLVATAAAPALMSEAAAEERYYADAGYTVFDGDGVTLAGATLRGGGHINDIFGLEAEGSFGTRDDQLEPGVEARLNQQLAAYVTARLPVGTRAKVFTRLGYGSVEIRSQRPGLFGTTEEADFELDGATLGVGGIYDVTRRLALRADLSAFEGDEGSLNVVTAGVSVRF